MRSLIVAILVSAATAGCGVDEGDSAVAARPQGSAASAVGEFDASRRGEPAPALAFERADGGRLTIGDLQGKPALVNLWATWCAPCIAEMPALDRLARARRGELAVVAVSQDIEGWTKVRPFLAKAKLGAMTVVLDDTGALAEALGAQGLPMTVLYDAEGREVWRVNGPREWDEPGGFREK